MKHHKSHNTSYHALFSLTSKPPIQHIEIPLIQRDYAQGRINPSVNRIRKNFLNTLRDAITRDNNPITLDFIYGEVHNTTFHPLDGQQRLTTLFLLHWLLAQRTENLTPNAPWTQFSYATRPSARLFCERLVSSNPPKTQNPLSPWLRDQPWFLHTWSLDPTISSMLTVLDDMATIFQNDDLHAAWQRLTCPTHPAISFHLLSVDDLGQSEDLYIKMNSRGKPLTDFENFKAHLQNLLTHHPDIPDPKVQEVMHKFDRTWSDIMWNLRNTIPQNKHTLDDLFTRYLRFLMELRLWTLGQDPQPQDNLIDHAAHLFHPTQTSALTSILFIESALDTWSLSGHPAPFPDLFTSSGDAPYPNPTTPTPNLVLFSGAPNLLHDCCTLYGDLNGKQRSFSLARTLLLYAVLLHRLHNTNHFPKRLRHLRNLLEASSNALRSKDMQGLLQDTETIILQGDLTTAKILNQTHAQDEQNKASLLQAHPNLTPTLHALEDHPILCGNLTAFLLDPKTLPNHARVFLDLFRDTSLLIDITAALLTQGDYARHFRPQAKQYGSSSNLDQWREVLALVTRQKLTNTRNILAKLLNLLAQTPQPELQQKLRDIRNDWLAEQEHKQRFGWRYYAVKYPKMRSGASGIYVRWDGSFDFRPCMLRVRQMNSYHRDPYLFAIYCNTKEEDRKHLEDPWYIGYNHRWLTFKRSNVAIRCAEDGFTLRRPQKQAPFQRFKTVLLQHGAHPNDPTNPSSTWHLPIPQTIINDTTFDLKDRIKHMNPLVQDLIGAML